MARQDRIHRANRRDGDARLQQAEAFLEQAVLSAELIEGQGQSNAAVSSAVLAGITDVNDLSQLLTLKTAAQYSSQTLRPREVDDAILRARRLVGFAKALRFS